jgi:ferritin-like metal-binding protein YciE
MKISSINQVFQTLLLSHDSGLRALTGGFSRITQTATSEQLAICLEEYIDQAVEQLRDSERLLREMKLKPSGEADTVIECLAKDAQAISDSDLQPEVLDLMLARAFLRIQHTQIASLSVLQALAEELGETEVRRFVRQAMEGEINSEEALSKLLEDSLVAKVAEEE